MTIYIIDFARAVFPVDTFKKHSCLLNHLEGQTRQPKLTSLIGLHPWLHKIKKNDVVIPMLNSKRCVFSYSDNVFSMMDYITRELKLTVISAHAFFKHLKKDLELNVQDPLDLLASGGEAETCYLYQNKLLSKAARGLIKDKRTIEPGLNNVLREQYLKTILKKINPGDHNVVLVDQIDGLFWSTMQPARLLDGVKQLPSIKRGELQVNIERRKLQVNQDGLIDFSDALPDELSPPVSNSAGFFNSESKSQSKPQMHQSCSNSAGRNPVLDRSPLAAPVQNNESAATARRTQSSIGVLMGVTCGLSCAGVGLLAIGIVSAFCPPVAIAVMCSWQGVVSASVGSIVLGAMLGFCYDILNANKTPRQDATKRDLNNGFFVNGDPVRYY